MKLIIVRHGETIENINRICQGHNGGHLSKNGIEQAEKLGLRLKDVPIDFIYSSDLKRAVDTANEIVKHHPDLELRLDERIRERCFGEMQGTIFPADFDWDNLPDCIEKIDEICARVDNFFNEICSKHKNDVVLVVCHGGTKNAFMTVIHKKDFHEYAKWGKIGNTAVSEFEIDEEGNAKMTVFNCTKHLE